MKNLELEAVELKGQRVLTTRQIAEAYGVEVKIIQRNFERNKKRYIVSKHYIPLEGAELQKLKTYRQIDGKLKFAPITYLWTEKGALLHAKSLNTDKAWEVYDWLVDFYFRAKEQVTKVPTVPMRVPKKEERLDIPNNKELQEKIRAIDEKCIAMRCLLRLYNRYLEPDNARGMQRALDAVGSGICLETYGLKDIRVSVKQEKERD